MAPANLSATDGILATVKVDCKIRICLDVQDRIQTSRLFSFSITLYVGQRMTTAWFRVSRWWASRSAGRGSAWIPPEIFVSIPRTNGR